MTLTRYLTEKEVPFQCRHGYYIHTSGNEYSDMKTAAILIDRAVNIHGIVRETVFVSVRQSRLPGPPICFYAATYRK